MRTDDSALVKVGLRLMALASLSLTASACGVTDQMEKVGKQGSAIVQPTCGPTDGAALSLFVTTTPDIPLQCENFRYGPPDEGEYIRVQIFGTRDVPSDTTLEFGRTVDTGFSHSEGGSGAKCSSPRDCLQAEYGKVRFFERTNTHSVPFEIELEFENSATLRLEDVARTCERLAICG